MRSVILAASRDKPGRSNSSPTAPITPQRGQAASSPGEARGRRGRGDPAAGRGRAAVSLDHLGEDTTDPEQAAAAAKAYLTMLDRLAGEGLTPAAEVSLKLSAVGQALPGDGEQIALEHAHLVCAAAERAGTTVTLDMEDHTTTDSTLRILGELRRDFPAHRRGAAVLPAPDRVRLPGPGHRRFAGPALQGRVRRAGVGRVPGPRTRSTCRTCGACRCLMAGAGYPMVATHDPRLIAIAADLAARHDREPDDVRVPDAVRHPAATSSAGWPGSGNTVRVYVPYGDGVVRLPHAPAGRATRRTSPSSCARWRPRDVVSRQYRGRARRRQARRGAAVRDAARRPARRRTLVVVVRRRGAGRSCWRSGTACARCPRPRRRRADVLLVTVKPQDIDGAGRRAGAARRRRRRWWSRSRPASRPAYYEKRLAGRDPGGPGHDQHAGAGRRGDERDLGRLARGRAAPALTEELLPPGRQGDPGAGVAAGRGDRAVRQRPGVLLLPGRGDDRRRHPARPARARSRPTCSCRPRSARR